MKDEKQNNDQIIDFTSQPLGVVSQEGEQIEDDLNEEYKRNEELRKQRSGEYSFTSSSPIPNMDSAVASMSNPAPIDLDALPKKEPNLQPAPEISNNEEKSTMIQDKFKVEQPIEQAVTKPVVNEAGAALQVEQAPVPGSTPVAQQVNNVTNSPTLQQNQENPGNLGVVLFVLLILFGGGAFFLFSTDKGNSLLGEEEPSVKEVADPSIEQDNKEIQLEEIKTFYMKVTLYASSSTSSLSITSSGVVDLVNGTSKLVQSGSLAGHSIKSVTFYYDYNNKVYYSEDPLDTGLWNKGEINALYLGPDQALEFLNSLGTPEKVRDDEYILNVRLGDMIKLVGSVEEFSQEQLDTTTKVEYYIDNTGRIKRIKYDFTDAYKGEFDKVYGVIEYSDINKYGNVEIPESVINNIK